MTTILYLVLFGDHSYYLQLVISLTILKQRKYKDFLCMIFVVHDLTEVSIVLNIIFHCLHCHIIQQSSFFFFFLKFRILVSLHFCARSLLTSKESLSGCWANANDSCTKYLSVPQLIMVFYDERNTLTIKV